MAAGPSICDVDFTRGSGDLLEMMHSSTFLAVCAAVLVAACGDAPVLPDASGRVDASAIDAAADAGDPSVDSGRDAGHDAGPSICPPPPACDADPPPYDPTESWRHSIASRFTTAQGAARHRGRDLLLRETDEQWALAKLAYGAADDDLEDEDVDVWLLRDCTTWERLGTATSTDDGGVPHPTVERIEDDGGRIYFRIPEARRLGPGRHRVHFVVRGDHSTADQYIHVLRGGERLAVADVDGTLTESETAEFLTVLSGPSPAVNPGAPDALWALAERGFIVFYVTARPDWLTTRTHEWVAERGLPPGLVHTTNNGFGALGGAAVTFKTEELAEIGERLGAPPDIAIGNKESDAEAYRTTGVPSGSRYLYQLDGDLMGGVGFDDYFELVPIFGALPTVCW